MVTNVKTERFNKLLNGENAPEFSSIIDIVSKWFGCISLIQILCFGNLSWRRVLKTNIVLVLISCIKNVTTSAGRRSRGAYRRATPG